MGFALQMRARDPELMDESECGYGDMRDCLRDLSVVNRVTMAYRPTLDFLERIVRQRGGSARPLRIVDVGCGSGDMLRIILEWALARDINVELTGLDRSPLVLRAARDASGGLPIRWIERGVLEGGDIPLAGYDVVISSLFAHHLTDAELPAFIRWMEDSAGIGWFVNDLRRDPVAYWGFMALAHLARWHPFVCHDGPLSVARAFCASDWRTLLCWVGIPATQVCVESWFPFRLCVARLKSGDAAC